MRQSALGLLILIAAPTIAWSDDFEDAKDAMEAKQKCYALMERGDECLEWYWPEGETMERGPECGLWAVVGEERRRRVEQGLRHDPRPTRAHLRAIEECKCNRHAHQDFGFGERIKYQWCKARY